jgi:hypothetical protein
MAVRMDDLQKQIVNAETGIIKMQNASIDELRKTLTGQQTTVETAFHRRSSPPQSPPPPAQQHQGR